MKLYLVRHAPAVARRIGRPDFDRALTAQGTARMRRIAKAMARLGIAPDAIYTSPLARARQTADILARTLDGNRQPQVAEGLSPGGRVDGCLRDIGERHRRSAAVVMLVGHEPDLGRLVSTLVWGEARSTLRLRKGGFCRLDVPPGRLRHGRCATLEWFVAPRLLRKRSSRPG
jgi:phosphohistidine phosphatase